MEPTVPKTLDWVKARAECSGEHLFMVLMQVVESDMKAANARASVALRFRASMATATSLLVSRQSTGRGSVDPETIAFERMNDGSVLVQVRRPDKPAVDLFSAKPHVDIKGDCKFEVDGKPMEPWEVSKRALEDLFFRYGLAAETET